ncbi:helix-turn-helix domain-containing protein [Roseibacillus ishigakijimensis]|uniref:Helix-turn-helix domain-containing protein n=1 Tax=Roseibacillus ishigakijimensis TaxID=454146 RepID=A0A934RMM5_9BACT|nr:helix-turn-helix domain-containing protein [Roseibacillus ishigakijimensis]MBK1833590.1 helix-turn-helix domain-containing protein [Roseibacillus ishigakijimensis]
MKSEPAGPLREKVQAVRLGLEGELNLKEIGHAVGRSRATMQTWFDLYRSDGTEGLKPSTSKRGLDSRLHEEASKELKKKLAKGSFRRAADAQEWLKRRLGIVASTNRVSYWLGKCGARLNVIRPRYPKKNEQDQFKPLNQLALSLFNTLSWKIHEGLVGTDG